MLRLILLSFVTLMFIAPSPVFAEDGEVESAAAEAPDPTYDERIALAKKMHEIRPVRAQVDAAIEQYAQSRPENERESFKSAMRNVFNIKALEKISVDAYAETFTLEELKAMVEYYSKPEARSASDKFGNYAATVYPEIVRMLDRAAIRIKTGE